MLAGETKQHGRPHFFMDVVIEIPVCLRDLTGGGLSSLTEFATTLCTKTGMEIFIFQYRYMLHTLNGNDRRGVFD